MKQRIKRKKTRDSNELILNKTLSCREKKDFLTSKYLDLKVY